MKFSCLTWNVAKKKKLIEQQIGFINQIGADIVALQEITVKTEYEFKKNLIKSYPHIISSFELISDLSILINKRMFGQLIASKFPLVAISPDELNIPWLERVLSVRILGEKEMLFYTTHIPPGSSNGWIKIDMISGLTRQLIANNNKLQILCGDFNTPQFELPDHGVVTFAQRLKNGIPITRKTFRGGLGKDWDAGERSLFEDLSKNGITDSFRSLHPGREEYSYQFIGKNRIYQKRFDHFFASDSFRVEEVEYLKEKPELSDHFPLLVRYMYTQ